MLKYTGVRLSAFNELHVDMYLFVKDCLRGGIFFIANRYSKANNPYIKNYDKTKEHVYIKYDDANNLYGHAMSQPLPVNNYKWINPMDFDKWEWAGTHPISVLSCPAIRVKVADG